MFAVLGPFGLPKDKGTFGGKMVLNLVCACSCVCSVASVLSDSLVIP